MNRYFNISKIIDDPGFHYKQRITIVQAPQIVILKTALIGSTIRVYIGDNPSVINPFKSGVGKVVRLDKYREHTVRALNPNFDDSLVLAIEFNFIEEDLPLEITITGTAFERSNESIAAIPQKYRLPSDKLIQDVIDKLDAMIDPHAYNTSCLVSSDVDTIFRFDPFCNCPRNRVIRETHFIEESDKPTSIFLKGGDFYEKDVVVESDDEVFEYGKDYTFKTLKIHKMAASDCELLIYGQIVTKPHVQGTIYVSYNAVGILGNNSSFEERVTDALDTIVNHMVTPKNIRHVDEVKELKDRVEKLEKSV